MRMPKEQIRRLIGPISEGAALLHGTCVEAALKLFETGYLPSGRRCFKELRGYIYFAPVNSEMPPGLRKEFQNFDRARALESAADYAGNHGEERYITEQAVAAGIPEAHAEKVMLEWIYGGNYNIPKRERELVNNLDYESIIRQASNRKGVVIEADRSILDIGVELDDEDDAVKLHCPRGLPAKYVKRIEPQGPEEVQIINNYLARIS